MSKKKLNQGCINIFRFLKLLYENRAYYKDVVEIYKNETEEKSDNNIQVVLNKTINALKVFGIKVVKEKNIYRLDTSLYSMNYTIEDLKSISIILSAIKDFPDKDIENDVNGLIKNLTLRMNSETQNKLNQMTSNYDFSFFYKNLKEQIADCKDLCKEQMILKIKYLQKGKELSVKCVAKELTYDEKTAYLHIYNKDNNLHEKIALPNILKIITEPNKSNKIELATSVIYRLTGRLAKTYKLKDNEQFLRKNEDGSISVINKNEPLEHLLSRLMRYSECCTIEKPAYIKQKMQELINSTLEQYSE